MGSEGKKVPSKGVYYKDGELFSYDSLNKLEIPEWTKKGYELEGFSCNVRGDEIESYEGWFKPKNGVATLYAVWKPIND